MRNPEALVVVLVAIVICLSSSTSVETVDSESRDTSREVEWKILTKFNYSSQIRLHPHLLLMVTVSWSGESRSLMKELVHAVTNQEKFGTLKLMVLYRNSERMLADALGATEGVRFLYHRHSLPYKYRGRLRVQSILSSVHYLMTLLPEELPLKFLNTPEDLKIYLESTDKALLLLEFCGWTPKLLAKGKNNGIEYAFGFNKETNGTLAVEERKNQKGIEHEKMTCGVGNGLNGIPWVGEFTLVSDSAFLEAEHMRPSDGNSCSFEEFQHFESFLSQFVTAARDFFLPPERLRFGLVPERALLSSLGVRDPGSWLTVLYFAGCPSCSKVLRDGDDLKRVLQMHSSLVAEMEGDEHDLEPALPANKPSILLFIDRSSDSLEVRRKSKEALKGFRELARQCQISNQMNEQNSAKPKKSSVEAYQASRSTFGHPRLELAPLSQKISLGNKMSIMVMNEGKHATLEKITSDLQGNSLHEILAYLLQHKKEITLSSLAKDVGFQLLSGDTDITIKEPLAAEAGVESNQVPAELPMEGLLIGTVDADKDQIQDMAGIFDGEHAELSKLTDSESSEHDDEKNSVDASTELPAKSDHSNTNKVVASAEDGNVAQETLLEVGKGNKQLLFEGFSGSFFFHDGNYRLLKALTAGSRIPSAVIIDPIEHQHYVLPEQAVFGYSLLYDFLDGFCNGSLLPYKRSESVVPRPKEAPSPPFVNLDFHEAYSFPRVTTDTFFELVIGNDSDSTNAGDAWEKDVLVLFSNTWCGFCQRMELVVREVYRAMKGSTNMLKDGSSNVNYGLSGDDVKNAMMKLPLIYLMDCTLNDCSLILKSMAQRELYPSLMLFPAKRKEALSYGGDMAVSDIIKFLADHGSNSVILVGRKGVLWTQLERGRDQNLYKEASLEKDKFHEIILKDRTPKTAVRYNKVRPRTENGSHETAPQVVAGSILTATNKLLNIHPFDKSKILIVKVNQSTGFIGLIINKHISWDSLEELEEGLELIREAPLSFGGPVVKHGMPLVALARKLMKDQYLEVLPNVYFLDQWATLNAIEGLKLGNQSVSYYWFFLGYSRWGWDQVFDEIAEGAWNISNGNMEELDWPRR